MEYALVAISQFVAIGLLVTAFVRRDLTVGLLGVLACAMGSRQCLGILGSDNTFVLDLIAMAAIAAAGYILLRRSWNTDMRRREIREPSNDPIEDFSDQAGSMALQIAEQDLELERLSASLKRSRRTQSDFITNLSHEIRQPLTTILGFADMLRETSQEESAKDIARTIRRNGQALMELLADCIDLANLDSGKIRSERKPCGPKQVIEEVAALIRQRCNSKALKFNLEYLGLLPELVSIDGERLRQVILNLGDNAVRFTEQGSVTFRCRMLESEQLLELSVTDTGIGMSEELQDRLFQPFSSGVGKCERFAGNGLGLAITRRLIDMIGGEIVVESELNKGSSFTVRVPVEAVANSRMIDPTKEPFRESERAAACSTLNCRILVVDDTRDNQKLISFVLKKAGAKVDLADDGAQGVSAVMKAEAAGKPYDLVIMDMQMPVLDGFNATSHLRSVGFQRPIVALTGLALDGDRERCLKAGCNDYLTKPIDRDALLATVSDLAIPTIQCEAPAMIG